MSLISEKDSHWIEKELGYEAKNIVNVAARCSKGNPTVLRLYPLRNADEDYKVKHRADFEPFPTLFWLCSKELKASVSLLEEQGWVENLQSRLLSDPSSLEMMHKSHIKYREARWALLSSQDRELVKKRNWTVPLQDVGVGGIRDFTKVKCLHTHYAHFLATGDNQIGEWVHNLLLEKGSSK